MNSASVPMTIVNDTFCILCDIQFKDNAESEKHFTQPCASETLYDAVDCYRCNGVRNYAPKGTVYPSSDGRFYCAIKSCEFSAANDCRFRNHCYSHDAPYVFKSEVEHYTTVVVRSTRNLKEELVRKKLFRYRKKIEPETVKQDTTPQISSPSNPQSSDMHALPDTAISAKETSFTPPPTPPPRPEANTEAALDKVQPSTNASLATQQGKPTTSADAIAGCSIVGVEQMKENLRAEYNKAVYEEALKNLRDPEAADIDGSAVRMKKIREYFAMTMESFE
ncbi:hypothetical protein BJ508DRAFT_328227 [Ascobolus immersus RN42]|uniref:Uncharacterized protein n=1 Tax=Ascobolus immersus RN42 TaxID=1160509 RepID=A0A3N4I060_ASCIM|nr:hypothetical protein BJ508DRAFT_328227 [Ascobolus immersus RN42]